MNITSVQVDYLIKQYFRELTLLMIDSATPTVLPLATKGSVSKDNQSRLRELLEAYSSLLSQRSKPVYKSRQEFLRALFMDANGETISYYTPTIDSSSTCMGGSKEDDPYYDPNWKMETYKADGHIYSKITKNLKTRFFRGTKCGWQNFNNRKEYIGSISLENVSIEEFEALFAPCWNVEFFDGDSEQLKSFQEDYKAFLDKVFIFEEIPEKSDEAKKKESAPVEECTLTDEELRIEEEYNASVWNHRRLFLDEEGGIINGRPYKIGHKTSLRVNDLIHINDETRVIKNIEVKYPKEGNHFMTFSTALYQ